jgi:predicted phage terminase large subunit-like protein
MSFLKQFENRSAQPEDRSKLKALLQEYLVKDSSQQRRELLKLYKEGYSLTGKDGLRRRLGAVDLEFFGKAYFPQYFSRRTPDFHRELDALWYQRVLKNETPDNPETVEQISRMPGSKQAVAAPRGHAKSTNVTFKDVMHATLYGYKHYIIILSDASDQTEGFLENIRTEIEENAAIKEDFGDLVGSKAWRNNVLLTATDIKIEGISSGKKIRGRKHRNWRPDLLVLDDIENDENVLTAEQRKKLKNWFFKAVSKAGDDYTDIFYIGTLLHYDSLLANILKNPGYKSRKYKAVISWAARRDLWDQWEEIYTDLDNEDHEADAKAYYEANRAEMLDGTEVLWEDKLSYYDLMVMRVTEGEASFNSEEQNEPINPEDCLFQEEWFDWFNPLEIDFSKDFLFYGFVDPSLGKKSAKRKSDFSTIITLAKHIKSGYLYDLDADIERRHPDKIITDVLEKERWLRQTFGRGFTKLGCETNQFQWFLKEKMAEASAAAELYIPIVEVNQISDKVARIQTLQPDVKNKYIKFNKQHKKLIEQLLQFPMGANDDGPDALEACRTLAKGSRISGKVKYESIVGRVFGAAKGAY